MKTRILASTKVGYSISKEETMLFSGHEAGICYMPDDLDTLFSENHEKTLKRAKGTLASGHHSVFGHVYYNFSFEKIPKILAMVLNNEKVYDTSEKSARYTEMEPSKDEEPIYYKWIKIFESRIKEVYPEIPEKNVHKLAMENARYMISIFTPATTMGYSTDFRQINYILHFMEDFYKESHSKAFDQKLEKVFEEFYSELFPLVGDEMLKDNKGRGLSLFAKRERKEELGENYCLNYKGTFAELAQAQRHRTLSYEIKIPEKKEFFVPFIIRGTELEEKWLSDIRTLEHNFPQGMLININERGTVEDFVLKCKERLCGAAQLEVALQTKESMDRYIESVKNTNMAVYEYLLPYSKGPRCTFPDYKCTNPCIWGAKNALNRKI